MVHRSEFDKAPAKAPDEVQDNASSSTTLQHCLLLTYSSQNQKSEINNPKFPFMHFVLPAPTQ